MSKNASFWVLVPWPGNVRKAVSVGNYIDTAGYRWAAKALWKIVPAISRQCAHADGCHLDRQGSKPCEHPVSIPWINLRLIRSGRSPWTRSRQQNPAIRVLRWRWRPWSTPCGRGFCASIPTIRHGRTATASVEAASPIGWDRYVGPTGTRIAMLSFGASAPYKDLFRHFGFTVSHVIAAAKQQIEQHKENHREPADIVA